MIYLFFNLCTLTGHLIRHSYPFRKKSCYSQPGSYNDAFKKKKKKLYYNTAMLKKFILSSRGKKKVTVREELNIICLPVYLAVYLSMYGHGKVVLAPLSAI